MSRWVVILFSLVFSIVFISCRQTKNLPNFSVSSIPEFINYDKVKIDYSNENNRYSVKGFIRFKKDSLLCFQFWGPLGYEVIKGYFAGNKLKAQLHNGSFISKESVETMLGLSVGNSLFKCLFLGFDSLSMEKIRKDNANIMEITNFKSNNNRISVSLYHKVNKKSIDIIYLKKDGVINNIQLKVKPDLMDISVHILEISYIDKICNFSF